MMYFGKSYNLRSLITRPACFENPENLFCIDLVPANSSYSFRSKSFTDKGLSHSHKMTASSHEVYREDPVLKLSNENLNVDTLNKFLRIYTDVLNLQAP